MTTTTVFSFWVEREQDFPDAADYLSMLKILDASCKRLHMNHVVLTDLDTAWALSLAGIENYAMALPRNLMRATTSAQARLMLSPYFQGQDIVFVGADCIINRDFVGVLPEADLSIVYMPAHKKWRMMNGFMHVPAESRAKVAPLFDRIAEDTSEVMCDDMAAIERALTPMPAGYGIAARQGLRVNFLEESVWNGRPKTADEPSQAYVMHFRGADRKAIFFDWAKTHGFA